MVPQAQRLYEFEGSDSEYIAYLESLVHQLRTNHPPPSPPHSIVRERAVDDSDGDNCPTKSLEFIPYQPARNDHDKCLTRTRKKVRTEPRWKGFMDQMINDITAEDWISKRKTVGLSSQVEILTALDILIHGIKPQMVSMAKERDLSDVRRHPSNTVVQLLNAFATSAAALEVQSTFATQIFHFRMLVFISLCCIALQNGADRVIVDEIMQRCVSNSSKNVARLRSGALWVNRMMAELAADGCDYLAYEAFVHWGQTASRYSMFADAGEEGFSYFKTRIPRFKPRLEIQASLPFWIPFIIKTTVGDVFSLATICIALGYGQDSRIHDYARYVENYRNREMRLPQPLSAKVSAPFPDQSRQQHYSVRSTENNAFCTTSPAVSQQQGERSSIALYQATTQANTDGQVIEVAQQNDCLSQPATNPQMLMIGDSSTVDGMAGYSGGLDLDIDFDRLGEEMSFFHDPWWFPIQ